MRNEITFHYDGPIARNHRLSVRTLSSTLSHFQSAIDRCVIDLRRGEVHKHARLSKTEYLLAEFEVGTPRDGGFILDLKNAGKLLIVDRLNAALSLAFGQATAEELPVINESLNAQALSRKQAVAVGAQVPESHTEIALRYGSAPAARRFSDRSINKELDQVLAEIRRPMYAGSTLEIQLAGATLSPKYEFDAHLAERFHKVVASRRLGHPVVVAVKMRAMDGGSTIGRANGKATRVDTGKGVGVVLPNLLEYLGSIVVLDIKLENFFLTSGWREGQGHEIFLFNPFAEDRRTHRWNPLSYVSSDPAFRISDIQSIAAMLYPDGNGDQKFWISQARNAFTAFALYLFENYENMVREGHPHAERNFPSLGGIFRLSTSSGGNLREYLEGLSSKTFLSSDAQVMVWGTSCWALDT